MGVHERIGLVLLPGMDGTGELLRPLAERLSVYGPVQVIDYPIDRRLSYDQLVVDVLDRVTADRFVVLGESFPDRSRSSLRQRCRESRGSSWHPALRGTRCLRGWRRLRSGSTFD